MDAVNFNKGCYLGQEIVERVRSRGQVHRLLTPLRIDGTEPPAPGTKLTAAGADAGEITSAAWSPALGKVAALGYVRSPHVAPAACCKWAIAPSQLPDLALAFWSFSN